jgi:hypothetical protein
MMEKRKKKDKNFHRSLWEFVVSFTPPLNVTDGYFVAIFLG